MVQLSHEFNANSDDEKDFVANARSILRVHPALMSIAWIDTERVWRRVVSSEVQFDGGPREEGDAIENAVSRVAYDAARDRHAAVYSAPYAAADGDMYIELHVPLYDHGAFEGTVVAVTSLASLGQQCGAAGRAHEIQPGAGRQQRRRAGAELRDRIAPRHAAWCDHREPAPRIPAVGHLPAGRGPTVRAATSPTTSSCGPWWRCRS